MPRTVPPAKRNSRPIQAHLQGQTEAAVMRREATATRRQIAWRSAHRGHGDGGRLAERRAQQPDEAFADACREHARLLTAAEGSLKEATEVLAALPDQSDELLEKHAALRSLESEAGRLASEYARLIGVLEEAGAEGLHGLLLEAEQRLAVAETELAALVRRANAACTLYQTMKSARTARSNYAAPSPSEHRIAWQARVRRAVRSRFDGRPADRVSPGRPDSRPQPPAWVCRNSWQCSRGWLAPRW